jgi:hypothetical protein
VGSEFATGIDLYWREDQPWVVLRLPSGWKTSIPAAWTDLQVGPMITSQDRPEILPEGLLELARHCQQLRQTPRKPRRSKTSSRPKE